VIQGLKKGDKYTPTTDLSGMVYDTLYPHHALLTEPATLSQVVCMNRHSSTGPVIVKIVDM